MTRLLLAAPLAPLYSGVVRLRNRLYDAGVLTVRRLEAPVIAVGNLTVGGTGKTPVTGYLADGLRARGFDVAILSRGYGRSGREPRLVSDGRDLVAGAAEAGDEPFLLARDHPGIPVAVSADRMAAARLLPPPRAPRLFLLDDAFQHRALERDVDVLLVDAEAPFGNGKILPLGPLREPLRGVRRANLILVTRGDGTIPPALRRVLERHHPTVPVFHATLSPRRVRGPDGALASLDVLAGRKAFAFSAIARPERFEADLGMTGARVVGSRRYRDHHPFSDADLKAIAAEAGSLGAECVVTTEKDRVRFPPLPASAPSLHSLVLGVEEKPGPRIVDHLLELLGRRHPAAAGAR
jgi:tetraacyldisaccharide 4'-kinase